MVQLVPPPSSLSPAIALPLALSLSLALALALTLSPPPRWDGFACETGGHADDMAVRAVSGLRD